MSQSEVHLRERFLENARDAQSFWALVREFGARVLHLHNSAGVPEIAAALVETRRHVLDLTAANDDNIHAASHANSKPDNVIPFPTKKESPPSMSVEQKAA